MTKLRILALSASLILGGAVSIAGSAGASIASNQSKAHHWFEHQGGKREISRLEKALDSVSTQANNGNVNGVGTACQNVRNDAEVAMAGNPIPVRSLQRLWNAALNDYAHGGGTCVNGVNNDSASQIDQATSDMTSGTALISQLTSEL